MIDRVVGTPILLRHAIRRDRSLLGAAAALFTLLVYASAAATPSLYADEAMRVEAARAFNDNAAIVALYGPILDVTSLGELAMTKMTVLYAAFLTLLTVVIVRRHTRTEEESGRADLLGGTAIGADAQLVAALAEALVVAVALGALAAAADVLGGLPPAGSLTFGLMWTCTGLVGAGIAAVACQLAASSRTCFGIAATTVLALYLVRALGDVGPSWASWLSPFGWNTRLRAWGDPRWWLVPCHLGLTVILVAAAALLRRRRDLGQGVLAARPGPERGSPHVADVLALTWRVHRPALLGWSLATAAFGALLGAIVPAVQDLLDSEEARAWVEALGGVGALEDTVVASFLAIGSVVLSCFGVLVVAHAGREEMEGRAEQVLATSTSRTRTLVASLIVAVAGVAWLLALLGFSTAVGLGRGLGDLTVAGLSQLPAVALVLALSTAAFTVAARWASAGWGLIAGFFVLGQVSELFGWPAWVADLSPYAHSPSMPAAAFDPVVAAVMTGLAGLVILIAWMRYRVRDVG